MAKNRIAERGAPLDASMLSLRAAGQVALIGLFVLALMAALYVTKGIVVPVLLAVIIGTILSPLVGWLQIYRIPRTASAIAIVTMLFGLLAFFAVVLTAPLTDWIGRSWELGSLLRAKLQDFREPLTALTDLYASLQSIGRDGAQAGEQIIVEASPDKSVTETAIAVLTPAISQLLIFFVSLIFYLIFKNDFKFSAVLAFSSRDTRLGILRVYNQVETRLTQFFTTFSLISIGLGAAVTLAMWMVGMPNPLLWGVLSALLNFFPYLGPAIVTIALIVASLLSYPTLAEATMPPLLYTLLHVIEGEFLTPTILGYRMSVNPFFLFLAVIFWTWMWGPIGAFLAVPIVMIIMTILETLRPADLSETRHLP
jgi:predicted PurR-regulated permease PerM